jgi:uncharacterized protein YndB with AHSA1/START domain
MVPDRIERETLVEAPPEVVWDVVTDPSQMKAWWGGVAADIDLRPGGLGNLSWEEFGASFPLRVETVERPWLFSFRWVYPEGTEPGEGNSLRVEFILSPEGEHTRLQVIESGLSKIDWSDERKSKYLDEHSRGWDRYVPEVARYAARQVEVQASR